MASEATVRATPALVHRAGVPARGAVILRDPETGEQFFTIAVEEVEALVSALRRAAEDAVEAAAQTPIMDAASIRLIGLTPGGRA